MSVMSQQCHADDISILWCRIDYLLLLIWIIKVPWHAVRSGTEGYRSLGGVPSSDEGWKHLPCKIKRIKWHYRRVAFKCHRRTLNLNKAARTLSLCYEPFFIHHVQVFAWLSYRQQVSSSPFFIFNTKVNLYGNR